MLGLVRLVGHGVKGGLLVPRGENERRIRRKIERRVKLGRNRRRLHAHWYLLDRLLLVRAQIQVQVLVQVGAEEGDYW